MTPAELDLHIAVLAHEDTHYLQKNWEASARWIFEHGAAGADIAAALPALVAVYLEATQIGVLRAAAAAVAVHDLRSGDCGRLRELLKKSRYRDWIFEGIGDAVGNGLKLGPAVGLILEGCGAREYQVVKLLLRHAGKRGFAAAAREVARLAPAMLPEFVKEAQAKKIAVEPALPELAAQLGAKELARNAATTLRWIVEVGADLAGVVKPLEAQLDAKDEDLAAEAGYCLAYHHAANRAWPAVDALLASKHARVAWAAARALRVRLLGSGGDDDPAIVDRVADGLLSADHDTAERSLVSLREAKARGRRCSPSPAVASRLAAALDDRVAEYLHFALPPAELRALVPAAGRAAERLAAACEAPVEACGICARLPRSGSWSYDSDRPPEYSNLEGRDGASRCPECGRYYGRHYEDEWDDMSHSETWSLVRWTPPEVLAELKGAQLKEYRESLDGWIARFRAELRHPALAVRKEAAYDLAAHFAAGALWTELEALLASSEDAVLVCALEAIRARPEDMTPLFPALRALLGSSHRTVRSRGAQILAARFVSAHDLDALRGLLDSPDPETLAATAEAVFQGTHRAFDAGPLFDRLAALRHRPEEAISGPARRALAVLAAKPGTPDALPLILADLDSPVAETRKSAAFEVQRLAPSRPEAAEAIPRLTALLADKECNLWSMHALQALADAGADILPAVPAIVACALDRNCDRREDMIYWLQRLVANGADLRPSLAPLAGLLAGSEALQSAAHQLLQDIFHRGGDLAAAVAPLRAMLDDAPPYLREYAGRLLAEWHLKSRDLEGLRFLLRHRNPEPPGVCADALRQAKADLVPLLPDLVPLAAHPRSWVRGCLGEALAAFAKSGPAAREAVVAALRDAGGDAGKILAKIGEMEAR